MERNTFVIINWIIIICNIVLRMYLPKHFYGRDRDVMVIVVGNRNGKSISNLDEAVCISL